MKKKVSFDLRFFIAVFATFMASSVVVAAPAALIQSVSYNSETITMQLTRENLRGPLFELWEQNSSGGYHPVTPVSERSYIGTVDEYPDAVSCGILQDDGTFRGTVYFDRGPTWFTSGTAVVGTRALGYDTFSDFKIPTTPSIGPGRQVGATMYGWDVAVDADNDYYSNAGSTAKAFEQIEYSVCSVRAIYMRDVLLQPYLARVILRAVKSQDPYDAVGGGSYLDAVKAEWKNNHANSTEDVVVGVTMVDVGGGLAWVGQIGGWNRYSVNDTYADGDFSIIWRHEVGHNWGCGHFVGGSPEGTGLMGGNWQGRISGCEAYNMVNHRDDILGQGGILDNMGTYSVIDLPPYGALDTGSFEQVVDPPLTIDVMANDYDANDDTLSILSFDTTTVNGGTVSQQGQNLVYTPHGSFLGVDSFYYTIIDSTNQTASGAVVVDVSVQYNDPQVPIANGSFEVGSGAGVPNDWTLTAGSSSDLGYDAGGSDGSQFLWIGPGVEITQDLGYILTEGEALTLKYDSQRGGGSYPRNIQLLAINGSTYQLMAESTEETGSGSWPTIQLDYTVAAQYAGQELAIRIISGGWNEIDNFRITTISGASLPSPFDGAYDVNSGLLSWVPDATAVSHDVYVGTDETAVQNATTASPEYQDTTTQTSYTASNLDTLTTYFWRVDTETSSQTITGYVWMFTTDKNIGTIREDIITHLTMDIADITGNTIADISGAPLYNGTIVGSPGNPTGQIDEGLAFTAAGQYVDLGASNIPAPWTVSTWVKRTGSQTHCDLINGSGTSLRLEQYDGNGKVGFTEYGVADYVFNYTAPLNTWVNLVFVGTASETELWVNGTLEDSVAPSISCPMNTISSAVASMRAIVDDLAVWERNLDSTEIDFIYNEGLAGRSFYATISRVSHWPFDTDAQDIIAGNDGTLENDAAVTNTPGEYRIGTGAVTLDGIDDYVSTPYAGLSGSAARTTSAWFKCDGATGSKQSIFHYGGTSVAGTRWGVWINNNDGSIINAINGGNANSTTTGLMDGQWHHVAVTFPAGGTLIRDIRIYVDGYEDTGFYTNGDTQAVNTSTENAFEIGMANGGTIYPFNGQIDDVRVYDRELTDAEILVLYTNSLVSHWPFDSDALDIVVGNDGTLENDAAVTNAPSQFRIGHGALTLDGIDDYVSTPYTGVSGSAARTTSAWFKCDGATGTKQSILHYGGTSVAGTRWGVWINNNDGSIINAINGGNANSTTTGLMDGQWHHVAVTFPAGGTLIRDIRIYVDGYEDTDFYTNGDTQIVNTSTENAFEIGMANGGTIYPFNGQTDDVRVYDRELTDAEILALYETDYIADIDGDGTVNLPDLAGLSTNWGINDCGSCSGADFTGDGNVGLDDAAILGAMWLQVF
jgi:hypothetical protein